MSLVDRRTFALTEEQQAIVGHDEGPAVVFAVAGSGKTTAMVHRIARLVDAGVFAPHHILATSFNRDANVQIGTALERWPHCASVQVRTLHALGYRLIGMAYQRGLLPHLQWEAARNQIERANYRVLYATLAAARRQEVAYVAELETLDHEDFLIYVGNCKGNLHYPDLARVDLPRSGRKMAQRAASPEYAPWYRPLFELYERVRAEMGLLTFDDMLLGGWETLVRYPEILAEVRSQFRCVLVDEFQDVNRAQWALLDLISAPHRNYMAIGDDDQTIYEWRGASHSYLLNFRRQYRAREFLITDNFRNRAGQIVLANAVIQQNAVRQPKRLHLTQGFSGETTLQAVTDSAEMAADMVGKIRAGLAAGVRPEQIAILVRVYAQTPPIEQAFLGAGIPYVVRGNTPFYQRVEIETLLNYGRLARVEAVVAAGGTLSVRQQERRGQLWLSIYNRPQRYVSRERAEQVLSLAVSERATIATVLKSSEEDAAGGGGGRVLEFAHTLEWLVAAQRGAGNSAEDILRELDKRLLYAGYLREQDSRDDSGVGKVDGLGVLFDFARGKGSIEQFLHHVDRLDTQHETGDAVVITSIFRAKGREWPLVFVPGCNERILPVEGAERVEEERRLLYVAITRAQDALHLYYQESEPLSPFLQNVDAATLLAAVEEIESALTRKPETWQPFDYAAVALNAQRLGMFPYFARWWQAGWQRKRKVAAAVLRFYAEAQAQGMLKQLGISSADIALWQELAGPEWQVDAAREPELAAYIQRFA